MTKTDFIKSVKIIKKIKVVSGLEPGCFEFRKTRAVCRQRDGHLDIPVVRQGGSDGEV